MDDREPLSLFYEFDIFFKNMNLVSPHHTLVTLTPTDVTLTATFARVFVTAVVADGAKCVTGTICEKTKSDCT